MTKESFLNELSKKLKGLPKEITEETVAYYEEIISDRLEGGENINDIIQSFGSIDTITADIINNVPLTKLVKEKVTPKRQLKTIEIILLILGSPIWFSLLIAAISIILAVFIMIWSVLITFVAVTFALGASAIGVLIGAIASFISNNVLDGFALIAAAMILSGLAILLGFMLKYVAKAVLIIHKNFFTALKKLFI